AFPFISRFGVEGSPAVRPLLCWRFRRRCGEASKRGAGMVRTMVAALAMTWALGWTQIGLAQATGPSFAVGPQYDSTHVYMSADDLPGFAKSFVATFGGTFAKPTVMT